MFKISLFLIIIAVTVVFFRFYWVDNIELSKESTSDKMELEKKLNDVKFDSEYKTYQKENRKITSHKTTISEFKKFRIRKYKKEDSLKDRAQIKDRFLSGDKSKYYLENQAQLIFTNSINPNWDKDLSKSLFRFQDDKTKIIVNKIDSWIDVSENNNAKYVERVNIYFLMPDGGRKSFTAKIDSESGSILETWNLTKHEPSGSSKKNTLTLPNSYN